MSDIVFRMKVETRILRENPAMAWRGHISADLMDEAATTIATLRRALRRIATLPAGTGIAEIRPIALDALK